MTCWHEVGGGGRGIKLYPLFNRSTESKYVIDATPRPLYPWGKDPVPTVQGAVWAPELVWTVTENHAPTGVRTSDRPARIKSLY